MSDKIRFRILARHRWIAGALITESVQSGEAADGISIRRFTATIRGYRNWKIYQGPSEPQVVDWILATVRAIRDRIDQGDDTIFEEPNQYATTLRERI